jgi:hypothetical protein
MNKKDFIDWKSNPMTRLVFKEIRQNIEGLKEELASTAGLDVRADGIKVGAIAALQDVLETDYVGDDNGN